MFDLGPHPGFALFYHRMSKSSSSLKMADTPYFTCGIGLFIEVLRLNFRDNKAPQCTNRQTRRTSHI